MRGGRRTGRWGRSGRWGALAILIVAAGLSAIPTIYMVDISFRNSAQSFAPVLITPAPTLANYAVVLASGGLGRFFFNSLVVATGSVLLTLVAASLLSFAIQRLKIPGGRIILLVVLSALLLPLASLLIPITVLLSHAGLTNTWIGLIGPTAAIGVPFATVILTEAMAAVPDELEEAAVLDGASSFTVLVRIVMPLTRSAVIVVAIWQFLYTWNEFFLALVIMTNNAVKTLPLAPLYFEGPYMTDPGKLFAILTLIAIVPMLFYVFLQRWFVGGLMAGGVKG
ncbi:MAG: carbohydrate ABC transporter permease [Acetobacteraceae bacterium]